MAFKYSDEIIQQAINLYNQGMSAVKVANKIKVNESTVRKWLKMENIKIRKGGEYSKVHDDVTIEKIIELYNLGKYTSEIEKQLGLKRGVASYLLRKNNINLRHRGPQSKIGRENFFDDINSQKKAYYLGWIIADGNISIINGQYSLKFHIALRDRELIDNFLNDIQSKNKSQIRNGNNPSYYVSLTSVHMVKSLMNLGVTPRKSGFEIFPKKIPNQLYPHFIRGLFDGDGITDIKRKRSGFVGSENIITSILKILDEELTIFHNKKNYNIVYFLGGKKFSKKLYEYMYNDASIYLERKRHRLEKICF